VLVAAEDAKLLATEEGPLRYFSSLQTPLPGMDAWLLVALEDRQ